MLHAIIRHRADYGCSPTVRELGDTLGITSANGVATHLKRLRELGRVDWIDGKARTLRVL